MGLAPLQLAIDVLVGGVVFGLMVLSGRTRKISAQRWLVSLGINLFVSDLWFAPFFTQPRYPDLLVWFLAIWVAIYVVLWSASLSRKVD